MITLRCEGRKGGSYTVYSCERYSVTREYLEREENSESEIPPDAIVRIVVRMFRHLNDDNPYYAFVGDRDPYGVAYVMNDSGKTIDTIR